MKRKCPRKYAIGFARILLLVWLGVNGLEVGHRFGHLMAGCSHQHHVEHVHLHEGSPEWTVTQEGCVWVSHDSDCELCDWMFSPLAKPAVNKVGKESHRVWIDRGLCHPEEGYEEPVWFTTCGKRGPPSCG